MDIANAKGILEQLERGEMTLSFIHYSEHLPVRRKRRAGRQIGHRPHGGSQHTAEAAAPEGAVQGHGERGQGIRVRRGTGRRLFPPEDRDSGGQGRPPGTAAPGRSHAHLPEKGKSVYPYSSHPRSDRPVAEDSWRSRRSPPCSTRNDVRATEQLPFYAEVLRKERPFGELEQRVLNFLAEERITNRSRRSPRRNRPSCNVLYVIWSHLSASSGQATPTANGPIAPGSSPEAKAGGAGPGADHLPGALARHRRGDGKFLNLNDTETKTRHHGPVEEGSSTRVSS